MTSPSYLDLWRPVERKRGPLRVVGGRSAGEPTRSTTYALTALASECDRVLEAAKGERNHVLNVAAYRMGQIIGAGELRVDDAVDRLGDAGRAIGLPEGEVDLLLRLDATGGLVKGQDDPRSVDPLPEWAPAAVSSFLDDDDEVEGEAGEGADDEDDDEEAEVEEAPFVDGGAFVLDAAEGTPAVWGEGDRVLWAQGEALIIAAGNGAGKTTLAGQLVRARLGLAARVLDLPVTPTTTRVLYLAMDRPRQIARSLARIFTEDDRAVLADRLLVWKGPPPADLAKHPELLVRMAQKAGADTVVVDSLKDAAVGLSDDEVGAGWNRARQLAIAAGVEVLELHHNVKRPAAEGTVGVNDVYGSTWITSGAGSVVLLLGDPGDPIVRLRHVKQPADEVGPFDVIHAGGFTTIAPDAADPLGMLAVQNLTAAHIASGLFGKADRVEVEKARRRLEALVAKGLAEVAIPGRRGGKDATPTVYRITDAGRRVVGVRALSSFEDDPS